MLSVPDLAAGASYGRWRMPWSPEEREDSGEILAWITRQPWSNGQECCPSLTSRMYFEACCVSQGLSGALEETCVEKMAL